MELNHRFIVPVSPEQAFAVLQDIERIGPCMPGATITSVDGNAFSGKVKVKLGPMQMTYAGDAEYTDLDADALRATIVARGREQRGAGTADAKVHAQLSEHPDGTEVVVVTDLAVTGKPAQFGRGVMEDVGGRLLDKFALCLAEELAAPPADVAADDQTSDSPSSGVGGAVGDALAPDLDRVPSAGNGSGPALVAPNKPARSADPEPVDLLGVAGGPLAKRVAPALGALAILWLVIRLVRRR